MSNSTGEQTTAQDAVVIAKIDGRFVRLVDPDSAPEGITTYTAVTLENSSMEDLGELYGSLAGQNPKKFKAKSTAIESIMFQGSRLPIFDPNKPKAAPQKSESTAKSEAVPARSKSQNVFELQFPKDLESRVKALPPQAKTLLLIMTDIGRTSFTEQELLDALNLPANVAKLNTKQAPARILQYYKGKLITVGLIKVT